MSRRRGRNLLLVCLAPRPALILVCVIFLGGAEQAKEHAESRPLMFLFSCPMFGWLVYLLVRPTTVCRRQWLRHVEMESGPLSYPRGRGPFAPPCPPRIPSPEVFVFDHVGFKGASARTNLSFHYLGKFWNDRISSVIVVNGVWRFYRDAHYGGDYWDLGPGYYECFFTSKGPDDVVSSFQAIELS